MQICPDLLIGTFPYIEQMQYKTAIMAIVGVAVIASVFTLNFSSETDAMPGPKDSSFVMGHVTAWVFDQDGNVKAYRQTDNAIVNTGLDIIANQVFGNGTIANGTAAGPAYATSGGTAKALALGTGGDGTPQAGQDDLTTYLTGCNNQTTSWIGGAGDVSTNVVLISNTTFSGTDGCAGQINEVGIFTDVSGTQNGRLFAIQEFGAVTVGSDDTLTINWDITFSDT